MNKQLKDILKAIIIVVGALTIIFLLLMFTGDDNENSNDFTEYLKETNYPIESYFFANNHKEDKKYQITDKGVEKKKDKQKTKNEKKLEDRIAELTKELDKKSKKYNLNEVFKSDEQIRAELVEKKRKEILNSRIGGYIPTQSFVSRSTTQVEKDYGASSFTNYNTKNKSSNETKLYRTITADNMIPIILVNPIDTSLGGKVTARVEDDIFASMGRALLIPKGSTVIGTYTPSNQLGFNRFPLQWNRILTPQGHNIILTAGMSADIKGYSGVVGVPDDRYWERYGIPLTLSTISNSILLMISQLGDDSSDSQRVILDSSRQDINYIMKNIINEQIKIQPKIIVKEGSRMFLNLNADIFFPIPQNGEIQVKYFNKLKPTN